ncbi:hypothetical protein PV379_41635 [Streptomyces caniscabiei]|uniref:hypothetical protein n=1 Tax=Streptomyces caniscabiei TaxID=2746961 RepID=UPI0029B424A3|nr:hypothetical protein [Streptomyces caniscabiei]MDX2603807.1 hypothetical protein [Streptomyces caniscabiei]MDX2738661.1 hypothetical protein [Streptomyces caniscabiei]MDX2783767.1 hypothetical protein [Streptomyces caniscabiei]
MMIAPPRPRGTTPQGDDVKRGEDPYRATPPPWRGWPSVETSRRRWRIALLVPLVGAAGCGLLFLLGVGALAALLVASRLSVPIPDGEPLAMTTAEVTGTWVDGEGGRLAFEEDGTFTSDGICGDFSDADLDAAVAPDPGVGTWELYTTDGPGSGEPSSEVQLTFTPGTVWTEYEARGTSRDPVLWMYIGDPDNGELCVLERAETPG